MVTDYQLARIVELRGLGYLHREIGEKLGLEDSAVAYHLTMIKKQAKEEGDNPTYVKIMSAGVLPEAMKAIEKIGGVVGST